MTASGQQWQVLFRARVLFDADARYSVHVGAFTGNQFTVSWNNTGGGTGVFARDFNIKQLFFAAEPVRGLELEAGGLYMTRGESTEITSYDNDAYILGERATWRRPSGPLAYVTGTIGHIGEYRTPNLFKRIEHFDDVNYGQVLVGLRAGPQVSVSADYTYEDSRDILREGVTVRVPATVPVVTTIKFDAYQRVSPDSGAGFNLSSDLRPVRPLTMTIGVTHIDENYLIPGYVAPNADRFERGRRFYHFGTYAITREWSVGWFHSEGFGNDFLIPNEHRFEVLASFNPTAWLKAMRVF